MATFIWQSQDGNWNNPESWGIAQVVTGAAAATTAASATVDLSADVPDLSGVAVGDTLKLVGNAEGKESGEYYRITAVDDGLDTVDVIPTPASNDSGITWIISDAIPGDTAAQNDAVRFHGPSMESVIAGLDQSAAVKLLELTTEKGYVGNIGDSNNPLLISSSSVLHESTGQMHYQDAGNATDLMIMNSINRACTIQGQGSSDFTDLRIAAGKVVISNAEMTELSVSHLVSSGGIATEVVVELSCEVLLVINLNAGVLRSFVESSPACVISGGTYIREANSNADLGTDWIILLGGEVVFNWNGTSNVWALGGFLDYSQDPRPKTISELRVFPGAVVNIPDWVTVTSGGLIYDRQPIYGG